MPAKKPAVAPELDLHLLVPVYNEAENFPRFYEGVKKHVHTPHDILVAYDREEDTTVPVVKALQKDDPHLHLVKNQTKGVIGALKTGLRHPKSGAIIVTMADGSDDHAQVDTMYSLYRDGAQVVSASRYSPGGAQKGGPLVKSLLSRTAGISLRLLAGVPTFDATNNYKLYSKTFLDQIEVESQGGFELAIELTVKAHLLGLKISEVPTVWTDRVAGESNFKLVKWLPFYLRWYLEAVGGRFGVKVPFPFVK